MPRFMDYQIDLIAWGPSSASQDLVTGYEWKATGEPEGRVSRLLSLLCCVSGPVGFYRPFIVCLTTIRSDKAQGNLQVYGLHHICVVPFDSRMAYGEVWGLLRTPKTLILSSSAADMIGGCHCSCSVASDRMACSDRPKGAQRAAPPGAVTLFSYMRRARWNCG